MPIPPVNDQPVRAGFLFTEYPKAMFRTGVPGTVDNVGVITVVVGDADQEAIARAQGYLLEGE